MAFSEDIYVIITDIESAIGQLDKNKSCGFDGIYAEHLKYCSRRILPLLAMCISALFIHGFFPDSMLSVVLVPIIKDKGRKINDSIGVNHPAIVREIPHFGFFPAFPHFCQNVPHFWLYFEITKIAENRNNFCCTETFCSKKL